MAVFVLGTVSRTPPVGFPPTPTLPREPPAGLAGPDTVTLDARAGDRWVRFDLARRRLALPGEPWDLAVKRHRLIVNGGTGLDGAGGVVRLETPFDQLRQAPAQGYQPSRVTPGGDTLNTVLDGWYRYGYLSHLLTPRPVTFAIRAHDGRFAKIAVLGYYCPSAQSGCLTLVYAYQGDGSGSFER